jgi:hypothetical protein
VVHSCCVAFVNFICRSVWQCIGLAEYYSEDTFSGMQRVKIVSDLVDVVQRARCKYNWLQTIVKRFELRDFVISYLLAQGARHERGSQCISAVLCICTSKVPFYSFSLYSQRDGFMLDMEYFCGLVSYSTDPNEPEVPPAQGWRRLPSRHISSSVLSTVGMY